MPVLNIAIIGSGTAGLAAAAFLTRDGHDVTLFERFDAPRPLGAGLLLQPTGLACLACLGLDGKAVAAGAKVVNLHGQSVQGRTVFDITYRSLKPHLFGLGIHRGALFSILYEEVTRLGVKVVTACEITGTALDAAKRTLTARDGKQYGPFDLVIDASGARSPLRAHGAGTRLDKPFPYGAVWGVCEDPGQGFGRDCLQQRYDGAGVMIGILPIGKRPSDKKDTVAFFWSLPVKSYKSWREAGLPAWKDRVLGYWPALEPFLAQIQSPDDLTLAQYSDIIMRRWHDAALVFIGDAAHCTSPQLGQGANLGLADALVLAAALREAPDIAAALALYSRRRRGPLSFYQAASRCLTPFFQSDSRAAGVVRDYTFELLCKTPYVRTEMLRTLAGIKSGLFTHLDPGRWHAAYALDEAAAGRKYPL